MDYLIDRIAQELALPSALLHEALEEAPHKFRRIVIRKKSGGRREMIQPSIKLKPLLDWIDHSILNHLMVSDIATAFEKRTSTVINARRHRNALFSVRIDLSEFFRSIRSADLLNAIADHSNVPNWLHDESTKRLLTLACFDHTDRLPIGYSTSPRIANVVMRKLDRALSQEISRKTDYGTATITRYADDFVFSTDKRGACNLFRDHLTQLLAQTESPALRINAEKTRFMSRTAGSTLVTGLRIKPSGETGVHPNYRDHVRLLLKLYANKRLRDEDVPRLRGHLAFITNADPRLLTALSFKFHREIATLKNEGSTDDSTLIKTEHLF